MPCFLVFMHEFTSIKNLRRIAGINGGRSRKNKYKTEDIIKILIDLYEENNRRLTTSELKLNKYPSTSTMQKHLEVNSLGKVWNKIEEYVIIK